MYSGGEILGASSVVASAIILPNTGGNVLLTISALLALTAGSAVIVTSIARLVAKKAYKK
ncbi:MAG TPA: hypothetical protein PKD20_02090 [Candidatus Saccharibacteria bacterium]|jgi:hypothetical protein|nr:hypothetical protein [Candidatus Saccharibacteria bacterium]HMT55650.1 hypothetical protein [Candidatus Saccharibacteria bacterium]